MVEKKEIVIYHILEKKVIDREKLFREWNNKGKLEIKVNDLFENKFFDMELREVEI